MLPTRLRQWHAYIGLFIAPSVLFFVFTGALQIFNLHERHGSYQPAVLLEKLSAVHKDQVFEKPQERAPPSTAESSLGAAQPATAPDDEDERTSLATLTLKWFFLIVAAGLLFSTSVGIWMGITQIRRRLLASTLLVAGALVPLVLLAI